MLSGPILVIAKDDDVCNVIEETLSKAGYSVETVQTGRRALQEVRRKPYSAAVVSAHLSDADSTDLLQRIKTRQPDIGGILLTHERSIETLQAGIDDGFQDVITTPLNPRRLLAGVDMIVESMTNSPKVLPSKMVSV